MAMDIVLVNCRSLSSDYRKPVEHLGLGYLAATLEHSGYKVDVIDASFHRLDMKTVCNRVLYQKPELVGFTLYYSNVAETLKIIKSMRNSGFRGHITLGGHHATFNAADILNDFPQVDSVVMGEGEEALSNLADCLSSKRGWHSIPNIAFQWHGHTITNRCRPLISRLDCLPFPKRDAYAGFLKRNKMAAVISSRGCYGACTFCSIHAFYQLSSGKPWRARRPENVADEIEFLVREYGIERIHFLDDEFVGPGDMGKERAWTLAEEIQRRNLGIAFNIICRPDVLDGELFKKLKSVGLDCVDIGIESWVPRQLALYGKKISVEQNLSALSFLNSLGLKYRLYVIPIDPYLTVTELLENLNSIRKAGLEHFYEASFLGKLVVFKGTSVEKKLREEGMLCISEKPAYMNFLDYEFQIYGDETSLSIDSPARA